MINPIYTKRTRRLLGWLQLATVAILGACDRGAPPAAAIGDVEVPEPVFASLADPERQLLADIVGFMSAVREGTTAVLLQPIVDREAAEALAAALPYALAARDQGWSESDLRAAYEQQPEWELVVRHLVRLVDSDAPPAAHDEARRVAETALERVRAGEDFARVAGELSQEPGAAERGGLLQPGRRGSWVDPFWAAAEALSPGQISDVVRTPYGYHVLRLDERRQVPFEEASRTALLLRAVSPALATRALAEWEAGDGAISVDRAAAGEVLEEITAGSAIPDSIIVARAADQLYRGADVVAGWARLDPAARTEIERGGIESFVSWVGGDGVVPIKARVAAAAGLDLPPEAQSSAEYAWNVRAATWSAALGASGLSATTADSELLDRARQALLSGAQEARAARLELRSLRPRLRQLYPLTVEP